MNATTGNRHEYVSYVLLLLEGIGRLMRLLICRHEHEAGDGQESSDFQYHRCQGTCFFILFYLLFRGRLGICDIDKTCRSILLDSELICMSL